MSAPARAAAPADTTHLAPLDALRALAALAVVALHIGALAGVFAHFPWIERLSSLGMFGVDLFYVLSGFFIMGAVLRPAQWSAGQFCAQRLRRIVPAYYVSMVLVLLGMYCAHRAEPGFWSAHLVSDVVRHALFVHNLARDSHGSLNGVYWTLGVEMSFYLLMLMLAPWLRRARVGWWLIAFFFGVAWAWRAGVFALAPADPAVRFFWATQLPGSLDSFAVGMLLAALQARKPALLGRLTGARVRGALAGATVLTLALLFAYVLPLRERYWAEGFATILWRTLLALGFGGLLLTFMLLPKAGRGERWLRASGLSWLGQVSYSLYLYHVPLIFAALWAAPEVPALRLRPVLFGVVLAALIVVAGVSYYLVEVPCQRLRQARTPARVFVVVALAFALLAGGALRWQGLEREGLWSDELFSVGIAAHVGAPGATPQHKALADLDIADHFWSWKQIDTAPPLYELLLKGWIVLFGSADVAVRALSVFCGVALIALAALLPRGSPPVVRWSFALAAAFCSVLIEYSQEARGYALVVALSGLVCVLLLRDVARSQQRLQPLAPSPGVLLAMAAMMATHYYAIAYCGLVAGLYAVVALRGRRWLRLLWLALPFVPVALYLVWGLDGILFKLASPAQQHASLIVSVLRAFKETARMLTPGWGSWIWLVLAALPWALRRVWRQLTERRIAPEEGAPAPPVAWLVVLTVPFLIVLGVATRGMEFFHPRYLLMALPPLLLLLAYAAAAARAQAQVLVALALGGMIVLGQGNWQTRPAVSKDQYREAAAYIVARFAPGDRVVGMWRTNRLLYAHYLQRALGPDVDAYLDGISAAEQIDATRAARVAAGRKVFLFDHVALRDMTDAARARLIRRGFHEVAREDFYHMGVVVLKR